MEILDTSIVNVSLPNIAGALSASNDDATWTLTSYLVANGIIVPVAGWLGRLIGRKRYFLICIAMFTVCSFLCGIATSLPQLVVFRLLQGLFGGGLQPAQQSVILDTFEPSERGKGFSLVAIAVIFAPILGPVLGGWITDDYSWRWVFLINVPVGIFAFISVAQLVDDPPWVQRDRAHPRDIDYCGLALIALGLGALQIMLDRGEDSDWFSSPFIQFVALLAAVGIVGGTAWLLMIEKPVVDLRCLKDRNFAVGVLMVAGIGAILYSTNVIIPVMAQQWFGYTALLAGLLLSPGAAVMIVLIPIVARLVLPNVQTRYVIAFGFFVLGCSAAFAYRLTPQMDFWTLASVPRLPDGGSGIPVRAEQHVVLLDAAAIAECGRHRAVFDVPQHLWLDRHRSDHGTGSGACAGASSVSDRASDSLRPAVSGAAGAPHADAAGDGPHRAECARCGDGADQPDAERTGGDPVLHGSLRLRRTRGVLPRAADAAVPRRCGGTASGR